MSMILFAGCRTPTKANRIAATLGKLNVTLIGVEAFTSEPRNSNEIPARTYELSGCTETVNGSLEQDGTVTFQAGKFDRSQPCELKIRALYNASDIRFVAEPGVIYWSRNVRISDTLTGQMVARANMQPVFERIVPRQPGKAFVIQVPVIYSPAVNDEPVTASLDCTPRIANVARYPDGGGPNKIFEFVTEVRTDTKFTCKYLWVSAGGIGQKYEGKLSGTPFEGFPDATIKLEPVELREVPRQPELNRSLPPGTGSIDVTTSPGACAADEVFNTLSRMCEKN
jgi:hypothetical protein